MNTREMMKATTRELQKMVDAGSITFLGDDLLFHHRGETYNVGNPEDVFAVFNRVKAYENKENTK